MKTFHYGHQQPKLPATVQNLPLWTPTKPNPTYPRESVESVESDAVSEEDTLESNQMVFIKEKRKCCEWGI